MGNGTSIGRVRGLGSARHGAQHWLAIRFAEVGNLILVPWFLISLALMPAYDYATIHAWLAQPLPAVAMILLILTTFYESKLGVQVMMEDYVHDHGLKFAAVVLLNLLPLVGAAYGILAVVRIALGGA